MSDAVRALKFAWRLTGATFALLMSTTVCAWEPDVHYGLTKWIALKVGYPEPQAERIANGNQGVDDSSITGPVVGTVASACLGSSPAGSRSEAANSAGSRSVHDHHFPSESEPPADPKDRFVAPGKVWRRNKLDPPPALNANRSSHLALGEHLHALQDTWSHQGEPDVPEFCPNKQLGWGHARLRGGWSCHLADLTYRWRQKDVPAMAKATYDTLAVARGRKPVVAWKALKPRVDAFAAAATKWEKDAWFKAEGFGSRRFLQATSLPDCAAGAKSCTPYPFEMLLERWKQVVDRSSREIEKLPEDVRGLFENLFAAMVSQSESKLRDLIEEPLAAITMQRALSIGQSCPEMYKAMHPFALGQAFFDGRGGHQPLAVCEVIAAYADKPGGTPCKDAENAARQAIAVATPRGPGLAQLLEKVKPLRPFSFGAWLDPQDEAYVAVARFVHLPRDKLFVRAKSVGDRNKIVGVFWLPHE